MNAPSNEPLPPKKFALPVFIFVLLGVLMVGYFIFKYPPTFDSRKPEVRISQLPDGTPVSSMPYLNGDHRRNNVEDTLDNLLLLQSNLTPNTTQGVVTLQPYTAQINRSYKVYTLQRDGRTFISVERVADAPPPR